MQSGDALLDHLFRRAGFGASASDLQAVAGMSYAAAVDYFVDYDKQPDDVDSKIGLPDYVSVTTRGQFSPNTNIDDARQRWLFRMVHTRRPLQEKMALFWHNHFGVGYSKVAGAVGAVLGTKMMANKAGETRAPATRSASGPPAVARAYGQNRKAAMVSNCLDSRSMSE